MCFKRRRRCEPLWPGTHQLLLLLAWTPLQWKATSHGTAQPLQLQAVPNPRAPSNLQMLRQLHLGAAHLGIQSMTRCRYSRQPGLQSSTKSLRLHCLRRHKTPMSRAQLRQARLRLRPLVASHASEKYSVTALCQALLLSLYAAQEVLWPQHRTGGNSPAMA